MGSRRFLAESQRLPVQHHRPGEIVQLPQSVAEVQVNAQALRPAGQGGAEVTDRFPGTRRLKFGQSHCEAMVDPEIVYMQGLRAPEERDGRWEVAEAFEVETDEVE